MPCGALRTALCMASRLATGWSIDSESCATVTEVELGVDMQCGDVLGLRMHGLAVGALAAHLQLVLLSDFAIFVDMARMRFSAYA